MSSKITRIVVMGIDKEEKHRAVVYSADQLEVATEAARKWGLRIGTAEGDAAIEVLKDLPKGDQFPSDKTQPALITQATYELLAKNIKTAAPPKAASQKSASLTSISPWEAIVVGSTVLAPDKDDGGFYYAIVEKVSTDQRSLVCSWKGYPKLPHFNVRRLAVGLIAVVK